MRAAFDLTAEDPRLLDRYGRTLFGHSTLIGRRLVESGVRFVNVTWDLFWDRIKVDYDAWDTHQRNFPILRENKLPNFDHTVPGLLADLETRGLLDETLVVVSSEMGRKPRIGDPRSGGQSGAGRDHWTACQSILLAGGGIRGGQVYGASDRRAEYPFDNVVGPEHIARTVYHAMAIDDLHAVDREGRPFHLLDDGRALTELF